MSEPRQEQLGEAIEHHRAGRFEDARAIYASILGEDPDCPEALNFLGMMSSQLGDPKLAVALLQRAVQVAPGYGDAHVNLGNVLVELNHTDDAISAYENALTCDPKNGNAHNNLGVLLRHAGALHRAVQHMLEAAALNPEWASAHLNLGNAYALMGYPDRAIKHLQRAVELEPGFSAAQTMLGHYLGATGNLEGAVQAFRKLLMMDPDNLVAAHMLAATSGKNVPERAAPKYVESTFDQFAASFEQKLARLDYRAPEIVAAELETRLPPPSSSLRVLDLGCGTGLCAPLVAEWARELVGVDLSLGMLERAAHRQLYDQLVNADIADYLTGPGESFDVMISADVLIYFGALNEVLDAAAGRLAPGGWLCFTVEKCGDEPANPAGYSLGHHGRFAHTRRYVETRIARAGLELVEIREEVIRSELKEPVPGWLVSARKPQGGAE